MPIGSLSAKKAPPPDELPIDQQKFFPAKSVFQKFKPKQPANNFSTKILIIGTIGILFVALVLRLLGILTSLTGLAILIFVGVGLVAIFCLVVVE